MGHRGGNHEILGEKRQPAVLLADSFDRKLRPLSLEMPRALIPLVNVPMINYAVEFLCASGVDFIYVVCRCFATEIEKYIGNSNWSMRYPSVKFQIIRNPSLMSVGDVLRHLHSLSTINESFVIMQADTVCNIDLRKVLLHHRMHLASDTDTLSTMVFSVGDKDLKSRVDDDQMALAFCSRTHQLLAVDNLSEDQEDIELARPLWETFPDIEVRTDVTDTHIAVCSPQVLEQFAENFDYSHFRSQFVRNALRDEVRGNKFFGFFVSGAYATRVKSFPLYHAVSQDIIRRWAYPLVPDSNLWGTKYKCAQHLVYREPEVTLQRGCSLLGNCVIAAGCHIGHGSTLKNCVLGHNCIIGENVKLENSYLLGDARVMSGCRVSFSILAPKVVLHENVICPRGVVLCPGVEISAGVVLKEGQRVTAVVGVSAEDEGECSEIHLDEGWSMARNSALKRTVEEGGEAEADEEVPVCDVDIVGTGGIGHLWEQQLNPALCMGFSQQLQEQLAWPDDSDSDEEEFLEERPLFEEFISEVHQSMYRAIEDSLHVEDIRHEINGLRSAHYSDIQQSCSMNVDDLKCQALLTGILNALCARAAARFSCQVTSLPGDALVGMIGELGPLLERWSSVLVDGRVNSQVNLLYNLLEYCDGEMSEDLTGDGAYVVWKGLFPHLLKSLYDHDVCEEEAILKWAGHLERSESPSQRQYHQQCLPFIEWLKTAEEEDEDEDSSAEESEND